MSEHARIEGDAPPAHIVALSVTVVKGLRMRRTPSIELSEQGAVGDRRWLVVDDRGRMVNGKQLGALQTVLAELDRERQELSLVFPDGRSVRAPIVEGPELTVGFFRRRRRGRLLPGPLAAALSEHVGQPLRLLDVGSGVDRGVAGAVSLISRGSLESLGSRAPGGDAAGLDSRRFRMLVEIDGIPAHGEDLWVGRRALIGERAIVRFEGHVGRCLVTSRHPESGEVDLPTLDMLAAYRRGLGSTEPLPFGIHGSVERAGRVAVGDPVTPLD
jgi:uncharacterized protein YcbX